MAPTGDSDFPSSQPAPKYGPSAVRDIHYVTGAKQAYVQIKQRKNGQYVVVERLPVHHKPRNHGIPTLQQSLAESEVKLNSIKPDWKPIPKVRDKQSSLSLPPIDLGWGKKVQPLVGSLDNMKHEPGGGKKSIPRNNIRWDARSKIGSLDNIDFNSKRTNTSQSDPLTSRRRSSNSLSSPVYRGVAHSGSLGPSLHYTPGGAEIVVKPRRYEHVRSRVGSLENITHVPGGGEIMVKTHNTKWKAESKIGSLDNAKHKAGGGDVSILNEKLDWNGKARVGSLDNATHVPGGGQVRIQRTKLEWEGRSRVGSLANIHHRPGGGLVTITDNRVTWHARPKVDTKPPRRRASFDSLDSY